MVSTVHHGPPVATGLAGRGPISTKAGRLTTCAGRTAAVTLPPASSYSLAGRPRTQTITRGPAHGPLTRHGAGRHVLRPAPRAVDAEQAKVLLEEVGDGWEVVTDSEGRLRLRRAYKVRDFLAGLELFERFGRVAEEQRHHPDLHLEGWNRVCVEMWTHAGGGLLTKKDFLTAKKLSDVDVSDLLWKPKPK